MSPAGRPTLYQTAFCAKVDEYIELTQDEWSEFHKTRGLSSDSYDRIVRVNLPSREGLAKFLGVSHDALSAWEREHDEFRVALAKLDAEQKSRLIQESLAGNYNPMIAKLVLSANHDMKEKSETDLTSKGEKITGIAVEFIRPHANQNPVP